MGLRLSPDKTLIKPPNRASAPGMTGTPSCTSCASRRPRCSWFGRMRRRGRATSLGRLREGLGRRDLRTGDARRYRRRAAGLPQPVHRRPLRLGGRLPRRTVTLRPEPAHPRAAAVQYRGQMVPVYYHHVRPLGIVEVQDASVGADPRVGWSNRVSSRPRFSTAAATRASLYCGWRTSPGTAAACSSAEFGTSSGDSLLPPRAQRHACAPASTSARAADAPSPRARAGDCDNSTLRSIGWGCMGVERLRAGRRAPGWRCLQSAAGQGAGHSWRWWPAAGGCWDTCTRCLASAPCEEIEADQARDSSVALTLRRDDRVAMSHNFKTSSPPTARTRPTPFRRGRSIGSWVRLSLSDTGHWSARAFR